LALIFGLSLGLITGIGTAFISELLRETFITPQELEKYTGYSVLATLPVHHSSLEELDLGEIAEEFESDDFKDFVDKYEETMFSHSYKSEGGIRNPVN
jgi:hypothetical protein